jgi:hypothetical protein
MYRELLRRIPALALANIDWPSRSFLSENQQEAEPIESNAAGITSPEAAWSAQ